MVVEAAGFAQLGDFGRAEQILKSLPADSQDDISVLAVRLVTAMGLSHWETGAELARQAVLTQEDDCKELAGRFYLAHARALCRAHRQADAAECLVKMAECWPDGQMEALRDPALKPLFF